MLGEVRRLKGLSRRYGTRWISEGLGCRVDELPLELLLEVDDSSRPGLVIPGGGTMIGTGCICSIGGCTTTGAGAAGSTIDPSESDSGCPGRGGKGC